VNDSCFGVSQDHRLLCERRSHKGFVFSARSGMNFPNWFIIPRKLRTSNTLLGSRISGMENSMWNVNSMFLETQWKLNVPSTGPWERNQGFLHITKVCRHRRVILIIRSGFPLGENPLVLSHHCKGLMYNRPNGIMLDSAAIKPSSL